MLLGHCFVDSGQTISTKLSILRVITLSGFRLADSGLTILSTKLSIITVTVVPFFANFVLGI